MKMLYNNRMKEYVTELTFISEKLSKYDEIITGRYLYNTLKYIIII